MAGRSIERVALASMASATPPPCLIDAQTMSSYMSLKYSNTCMKIAAVSETGHSTEEISRKVRLISGWPTPKLYANAKGNPQIQKKNRMSQMLSLGTTTPLAHI